VQRQFHQVQNEQHLYFMRKQSQSLLEDTIVELKSGRGFYAKNVKENDSHMAGSVSDSKSANPHRRTKTSHKTRVVVLLYHSLQV
jgi:hypothetical protein